MFCVLLFDGKINKKKRTTNPISGKLMFFVCGELIVDYRKEKNRGR
jgi:hypothetical protein